MKILIASARTMNERSSEGLSLPAFLDKTLELSLCLKKKNTDELAEIWNVSKEKAYLWKEELLHTDLEKDWTAAVFCYEGVVFRQFNDCIHSDNKNYVDEHLRILSAYYGLLKPFDGIRQYRLEMGSKMKIGNKNLYDYWNDTLYKELNDELIVNLASEEYGKCIRKFIKGNDRFIDVEFTEILSDKERHASANMKKARGQMLRYMIENEIEDIEKMKKFSWDGYQYMEKLSSENKMVFHKIVD